MVFIFMLYPTGDVSLVPDVSVELVVNIMEGFPNTYLSVSFCFSSPISPVFLFSPKFILLCFRKKYPYSFSILLFLLDGRKPSVAAIQGLALGGGLELTMVAIFYLLVFQQCFLS